MPFNLLCLLITYKCVWFVQGWFLAHFPEVYPHDHNDKYKQNYPCAARWIPHRGHANPKPYRLALDRLEMDDVTWMPYEDHREIQEFVEICWYSGWIMCGRDIIYRHLPERVKRQYGYVQDIPRAPTSVLPLPFQAVAQAFLDFRVHIIPQAAWGREVDQPWQYEEGYMRWYGHVSHPKILPPIDGSPPRPANEEQIIAHHQQRHQERGSPDTIDMVGGLASQADDYLGQEAMSSEQLYQAMRHIRDMMTPILSRRSRRRQQQQHDDQDQD